MKRTLIVAVVALCTSVLFPSQFAFAGEPASSVSAVPASDSVSSIQEAGEEKLGATEEGKLGAAENKREPAIFSTAAASSTLKTTGQVSTNALSDGVYNIYSALRSDAALDVAGAATNNGAKVQIYSDNTTPAQRWRIESLNNGFYRITNVASEKVLDVTNGKAFSGNKVQQYAWNGTKAQQWKITSVDGGFIITSALSSALVLDVRSANKNSGTQVQVYTSNSTKAQIWKFDQITQELNDGYYVFTNTGSGLAVDISSGSFENKANVQQYTANETLAQTYQASYNKNNGYYTLRNVGSGKALDVANGATKAGANVWQYSPNGTWAQYWDISKNKNGSLTLKSAKSGKALDVSRASKNNGANIQIWNSNGTPAQQWKASKVANWLPEDTYFIHSAKVHNNVLDVEDISQANNANIQAYAKNGSNAQRFYLRPTGNGYYTIQNVFSEKYVAAASGASDANVAQTTAEEQWKPILQNNGIVFQLKRNPQVVLDLSNGSTKNGANIKVHTNNGSLAQKWLLKSAQTKSSYNTLNITLAQIVKWNWDSNKYAREYAGTTAKLRAYMNPANGSIYQFTDLRQTTPTTAAQLDSFITSNALGSSGKLKGMGSVFVAAAQKYNINQDYLLAHAILESAWGTSNFAKGTKVGKTTYYNFYGIGAYDSDPNNAVTTAGSYGWSSPEAAIDGAAKWIANNYVYRSGTPQYTLYGMKWDYAYSDKNKTYGWHQYATDPRWAQSIAQIMEQIYSKTGTGGNLSFVVPQYK